MYPSPALGQVPAASNEQVLGALLGTAALVGIVWGVAKCYNEVRAAVYGPPQPAVPRGEKVVLREELDGIQEAIEGKIAALSESVDEKNQVISDKYDQLNTYTHKSIHDIRSSLQAILMGMAANEARIRQEVAQSGERVGERLERVTVAVARVQTTLALRHALPAEGEGEGGHN